MCKRDYIDYRGVFSNGKFVFLVFTVKILQIGKYPPDAYMGGIERTVHSLSQYLAKENQVEVVASSLNRKGWIKHSDNLTYKSLPTWFVVSSTPVSPSLVKYLKQARDFDIIQISLQNPIAVLAYLFAKPKGKLVIWYHNDIVRQRILSIFFKPFLSMILRKASCIVATNEPYIQSSEMLSLFREKTVVLPHGIDNVNELNSGDNKRQSLSLRKKYGEPIVLFVGRLVYYKGIENLIEAMKGVNARLLIVGQGPLERKLKAQVKNLGLNDKIFFINVPYNESVGKYLHACDVLVLPSINKAEAFGVVLLEAMACGKPVVTTEIGTGTSYVCQDGVTGFVVPPKNPAALAEAINKILADSQLRTKMGEAGEKRLEENFTIEKMGESFLKLYKKLLENSAHAA